MLKMFLPRPECLMRDNYCRLILTISQTSVTCVSSREICDIYSVIKSNEIQWDTTNYIKQERRAIKTTPGLIKAKVDKVYRLWASQIWAPKLFKDFGIN